MHTFPKCISNMWNANSFVLDLNFAAMLISYKAKHYAMNVCVWERERLTFLFNGKIAGLQPQSKKIQIPLTLLDSLSG